MGGRAGGGARGTSQYALSGAAARNEMRGMTANDFFHYALTHKEYQKYVKDENARRGNPVVFGNQGVEVGHMVHAKFTVNGSTYSTTGIVKGFDGDKAIIESHGGYSHYFPKSSITHYAKDKSIGYGRFIMKTSAKQKVIELGPKSK